MNKSLGDRNFYPQNRYSCTMWHHKNLTHLQKWTARQKNNIHLSIFFYLTLVSTWLIFFQQSWYYKCNITYHFRRYCYNLCFMIHYRNWIIKERNILFISIIFCLYNLVGFSSLLINYLVVSMVLVWFWRFEVWSHI